MGDATDLDRWAIIDAAEMPPGARDELCYTGDEGWIVEDYTEFVGGFADDEAAAQWIADQYGDGLTAITRWAGPCDSWGRRYIEVTAIEPA